MAAIVDAKPHFGLIHTPHRNPFEDHPYDDLLSFKVKNV